jgi:hypothetical protein
MALAFPVGWSRPSNDIRACAPSPTAEKLLAEIETGVTTSSACGTQSTAHRLPSTAYPPSRDGSTTPAERAHASHAATSSASTSRRARQIALLAGIALEVTAPTHPRRTAATATAP